MKGLRLEVALVAVLVACEPVATPAERSTEPATEAPTERDLSFPGGGRILFLASRGPGYTWRKVGVVGADGIARYFHRNRNAFPYWDPAAPGRILTLPYGPPVVTRSLEIVGDRLRPIESWHTAEVWTFPSLDGRTIAFVPVDRSGRQRSDRLRLIDRSTGTVKTVVSGGLVPFGWAPDGKLIAAPATGGPLVRWNPWTGATSPFRDRLRTTEIEWDPEGRTYAGALGGDPDGAEGFVVIGTASGKVLTRIPVGRRWVEMPTWSPDGTRIAFIVRGGGRQGHRTASLHVYDVTRRVDHVVARPVSDASWASWSPDGRWLLLADWTRDRWLFVAADGSRRIAYPWLGAFPRWCCPSSPPSTTAIPVS